MVSPRRDPQKSAAQLRKEKQQKEKEPVRQVLRAE